MNPSLPDELILSLSESIPCRELQIRHLATLLGSSFSSPPSLVAYGLEATGKSLTIQAVLKSIGLPTAIVRSRECIVARHLLERTIAATQEALSEHCEEEPAKDVEGRCDSVSTFVVQLQHLLEGKGKFFLVFDGIDRQREASPTLLAAIARLGEIIPDLTVILVVTSPRARLLHLLGVPHIHFPPYTRAESISIVSKSPLPLCTVQSVTDTLESQSLQSPTDCAWLWSRFCGAVWDSIGQGAARDIISFRDVCERLWNPFVQPVVDGNYGVRDFMKLMVKNRGLFQGEAALIESIIPATTDLKIHRTKMTHDLPYYTKFLLCAAYLASYNPARQDVIFFTKASEKKRRKKGGGTAVSHHRPSKHRKIQRRLLGPQAFVLERLFAIFHSILPHRIRGGGADIMTQLATLASLRLMVNTAGGGDVLEAGTKWRVNAGWEYIQQLSRSVRFDIESYVAE